METQPQTLEFLVKLASLGTAGISIFGIFYAGIIIKGLPNDVTPARLSSVRMFTNLCIIVSVICAASGGLNAYFNMKKIQDAREQTAEITNQYTMKMDSLRVSKEKIEKDISTLRKLIANQPGTSTDAAEVLTRINSNVNLMRLNSSADLIRRRH